MIGSTIRGYQVIEQLGRGSQAKTYKAKHLESGQVVALKALHMTDVEDWKTVELFEREAEVLRAIDHPFVPDYIDAWSEQDDASLQLYIAQEFVDGPHLGAQLAKEGRWSETRARQSLVALLQTLESLHNKVPPIVHRDIKPQNIIEDDAGLYLIDFGAVQSSVMSTVGGSTVIGTPGYMPMEQMVGRATPASDIYSLGVTLCHMMTGVAPTDVDMKDGALAYGPLLPEGQLKTILLKMIHPTVEQRWQNTQQVLNALQRAPDAPDIDLHSPAQLEGRKRWASFSHERLDGVEDKLEIWAGPRELLNSFGSRWFKESQTAQGWQALESLRCNALPLHEVVNYYRSDDGLLMLEEAEGASDHFRRVVTFFTNGSSLSTGGGLNEYPARHMTTVMNSETPEEWMGDGPDENAQVNPFWLLEREHRKKLEALMDEGLVPISHPTPTQTYRWIRAVHPSAFFDERGTRDDGTLLTKGSLLSARMGFSLMMLMLMFLPILMAYSLWHTRKLNHTHGLQRQQWGDEMPPDLPAYAGDGVESTESGVTFDFDASVESKDAQQMVEHSVSG